MLAYIHIYECHGASRFLRQVHAMDGEVQSESAVEMPVLDAS